ncbi:manganese efflux pump MntP family protein [bacterium]|nr:manganese efflux pump MntP family protein [bacterium]
MDTLTLLFIAFALGIDAFAVSVSAGAYLLRPDARQTFRLSFHFGLFQALMPILGWLAGSGFADAIAAYDHWIAFTLLAVVGGHMLWNSFGVGEDKEILRDVTRGWSLVSLSVATSIDALAVGLSLSLVSVEIIFPSIVIGIVAGIMSLIGIRLGERVAARFGTHMEFIGGIILILIGVRILVEHLTSSA